MKYWLTISILLVLIASAEDLYSHALLKYSPGSFDSINEEFRQWLDSGVETDTKMTSRIRKTEEEGLPTPQLVFINSKGESQETVFIDHIPVSMVKNLFKDKKFEDAEVKKDDL